MTIELGTRGVDHCVAFFRCLRRFGCTGVSIDEVAIWSIGVGLSVESSIYTSK